MLSFKGVGPAKIGSISKQLSPRSLSAFEIACSMADAISLSCDIEMLKTSVGKASSKLNAAMRADCGIVTLLDQSYPSRLRLLRTAPPVLFFRGDMSLLEKCIAVIGTRSPSEDALDASLKIADALTASGAGICNGLAQGVDERALTTKSGYRTAAVGVVAGGIVGELRSTLSAKTATIAGGILAQGGLIVSESLPDRCEDMYSLISACRIQAGISRGIVLVQSTANGGSMYTIKAGIEVECPIAAYLPEEKFKADSRYDANRSMCSAEKLDGHKRSQIRKPTSLYTIRSKSIELDSTQFVSVAFSEKPPARMEQMELL